MFDVRRSPDLRGVFGFARVLMAEKPEQVAHQVRAQDVITAEIAVLVVVDNLRLPEDRQVLRHIRLPYMEQVLDVGDALGRLEQFVQQREPNRMAQQTQAVGRPSASGGSDSRGVSFGCSHIRI